MLIQNYNPLEQREEIFRLSVDGHYQPYVEMNSYVSPEVIVMKGQDRQVIAQYDVARLFSVSPQKVSNYLQVSDGVFVSRGDLLAASGGIEVKELLAPEDAIVGLNDQYIILYSPYDEVTVKSGVWGRVVYVDQQGVSVKSDCLVINAVLGIGGDATGYFHMLSKTDKPIDVTKVTRSQRGRIVYVPFHVSYRGYLHLIELGARGVISPGIRWEDYTQLYQRYENNWPIPLIVTQGWGSVHSFKFFFSLIKWVQGKRVKLFGTEKQIAISWDESQHSSIIKGFDISNTGDAKHFAKPQIRDRIKMPDAREGAVKSIMDEDYLLVKVAGKKELVHRREVMRITPHV